MHPCERLLGQASQRRRWRFVFLGEAVLLEDMNETRPVVACDAGGPVAEQCGDLSPVFRDVEKARAEWGGENQLFTPEQLDALLAHVRGRGFPGTARCATAC